MPFLLTIAQGKESGREFTFEQDSVLIGRTDDCDVVLYESGVSRRHARIFLDGNTFAIEDLGSSNGTLVNGAKIERHVLQENDMVGVGPLLFRFSAANSTSLTEIPLMGDGGMHTRIVSDTELQRSHNKGVAGASKGVSQAELAKLSRAQTGLLPAIAASAPRPSAIIRPDDEPSFPEDPHEINETMSGLKVVPPKALSKKPAPLTAAERARMKRESNAVVAGAKIFWAEASDAQRIAASLALTVLLLSVLGTFAWLTWPKDDTVKQVEATRLDGIPIEDSFGLGPGVTFERPDQKTFEFDVTTPVQAIAVLHTQSKDISSNEVIVSVNGAEIGKLPADTINTEERVTELVIPSTLLKRNETNIVTFDSVKNPPQSDPWRIWNTWIEIAVLPEIDEAGLIADAEKKMQRGTKREAQKDMAAGNAWDAYKAFREAWLTLESLPNERRPANHGLAIAKMKEMAVHLDLQCQKMLLQSRAEASRRQFDKASATLEFINQHFPSRQHPCQLRADQQRRELDL
jgi:Inner membrane component of T3SS, cytoplasmic domain